MPQTEQPRVLTTQSEPPSPTKELGVVQRAMPPPGFARVTACLQRDQAPEGVSNPDTLRMAVLSGPTVVTMSASCIVKDEVTGVMYMDVTLSGPGQEASTQGPTIQDIMDLM